MIDRCPVRRAGKTASIQAVGSVSDERVVGPTPTPRGSTQPLARQKAIENERVSVILLHLGSHPEKVTPIKKFSEMPGGGRQVSDVGLHDGLAIAAQIHRAGGKVVLQRLRALPSGGVPGQGRK